MILDDFQHRIEIAIQEQTKKLIDRMSILAKRAADKEVSKLMTVISVGDGEDSAMMGQPYQPSKLREFSSPWPMLNEEYVRRKGHDRFFERKGWLHRELVDYDPVELFGSTSVSNVAFLSNPGIRVMTISPFPRARWLLQGGKFRDLDRTFIGDLDESVYHKLANRPNKYRALLGPSMLYFAKYRIPRAVTRALKAAGYEVRS